ncbi:hypothetical protein ACFVV7_35965 [Streptomyces globisporus]|uniref:hypothetical protein n=1 Tax=Streptomyces globisporus TaxID=1908 RepID=UPI0036D9627B
MSADFIPPPDNVPPDVWEQPDAVRAAYATWGFVAEPTPDQPMPALIVGNDTLELHLELVPEVLHELLTGLEAHAQFADVSPAGYTGEPVPSALPRRVGKRAVVASGWPAANGWWRAADGNTRIIVAGIIAAVMVLGLLVTF